MFDIRLKIVELKMINGEPWIRIGVSDNREHINRPRSAPDNVLEGKLHTTAELNASYYKGYRDGFDRLYSQMQQQIKGLKRHDTQE